MARRRSAEQVEETAPVVEATRGRKAEPRECECQCGAMTGGGRFVVGHDMKRKSALLVAFDAGDDAAGAELISRGWRTEESLDARRIDGPAARKEATREARIGQRLATLDRKIAALTTERAALVAMIGEGAS